MQPDDHVCLCFRVSLRKIRAYMEREDPPVASLISECLGAGTGCQWCVPFLKELHRQHAEGDGLGPNGEPDLKVSPEEYASGRSRFRKGDKSHDSGQSSPENPDQPDDAD